MGNQQTKELTLIPTGAALNSAYRHVICITPTSNSTQLCRIQSAEKFYVQTSWGIGWTETYLLLCSYVSHVCPCDASDHQGGSDRGWKTNKIAEV